MGAEPLAREGLVGEGWLRVRQHSGSKAAVEKMKLKRCIMKGDMKNGPHQGGTPNVPAHSPPTKQNSELETPACAPTVQTLCLFINLNLILILVAAPLRHRLSPA